MITEVILKHRVMSVALAGIISGGMASYKGVCDAQGIPTPNTAVNLAILAGPAVIQGAVGGYRGLIYAVADHWDSGGISLVLKGAGMGAALGGLETAIGYSIGYTIGSFLKN